MDMSRQRKLQNELLSPMNRKLGHSFVWLRLAGQSIVHESRRWQVIYFQCKNWNYFLYYLFLLVFGSF